MGTRFRMTLAMAAAVVTLAVPVASAAHASSTGTPGTAVGLTEQQALARLAFARMLHLRAQHEPGSITGSVLDPAGHPLADACVTAIGTEFAAATLSDQVGRYTIGGLRPGTYRLAYRECAGRLRNKTVSSGGTALASRAATAQVAAGAVKLVPPVRLLPTQPLVPALPAWLRHPAAPLSAAELASTGRVSGLVTGGGKPVRGVCVEVIPVNSGQGFGAFTSASGRYVVSGVTPGRYQVQFASEFSCPDPGNWLQQWYPNRTAQFTPQNATTIRIRAGKTLTGIDAALRRGGEIAGTVTGTARPLAGICVTVDGRVPGGYIATGTATDKNGRYALQGLFPGSYVIGFTTGCGNKGNFAPQWWPHAAAARAARPVRITGARIASHIGAALGPGAAVTGVVRIGSAHGKPAAGICVNASNADFSEQASATTGRNGSYRLTGLGTGRFSVQFQPGCGNQANLVTVTKQVNAVAGRSTMHMDAVMQPAGEISGRVTDRHGKPLFGICLNIQGPLTSGVNVPKGTNPDGSYAITGLAPGSYDVGFSGGCGNSGSVAPQSYNNQADPLGADPIKVRTGQRVTGINAAMSPGGVVTGRVTDPAGHPLSNVCIGIARPSLAASFPGAYDDIVGSAGGIYRAENLAPGLYYVAFGCISSGPAGQLVVRQWFNGALALRKADLVSVEPAVVTAGIDAVLTPTGAITGQVTNQHGHPLAGVCVNAYNAADGLASGGLEGIFTDARGRYQITGLTAGTYLVEFAGTNCQMSQYVTQWYRGQARISRAAKVQVRTGAITSGIDASMIVGGSISGVVTARGRPLPGACVFASNIGTGQVSVNGAGTGQPGGYRVTGLGSGRYVVHFSACGTRPDLSDVIKHVTVHAPHAVTSFNADLPPVGTNPGGSIAGTIIAGTPGRPVADTCAEAIPLSSSGTFGFAFTDRRGRYRMLGLEEGGYKVFFGDPGCQLIGENGLAPQWWKNQPTQRTATVVTVADGQAITGIDAKLLYDGQVTGQVTGPGGAAVTGACVTAVPVGAIISPTPGVRAPDIVAVTRSGRYTLIDLLPARYKVSFGSGCGASGYRTQWWKDANSKSRATVITVPAATTVRGIDAALQR